jgi:hypothetical protein
MRYHWEKNYERGMGKYALTGAMAHPIACALNTIRLGVFLKS